MIDYNKGFIISVDLGQVNDYTAITIIERNTRPPANSRSYSYWEEIKECSLRHIERPELGTPYPKIVERIAQLYNSPELCKQQTAVVIDLTGVGRPVWDYMYQLNFHGSYFYGITITGGNDPVWNGRMVNVPKRDLISALQVAFQNKDFKIAKNIPHSETLIKELVNFKVKININGHDQYEAWREGTHDDIVLSAAMGVWLAQQDHMSFEIFKGHMNTTR